MILEVLVSCMNQKDISIVDQSDITTNVLIVNQCDKKTFQQHEREEQMIRMISTTERGLSRSRNMAINYAAGDICLFCDNDELFYRNYDQVVLAAFQRLQDADIILFDFNNLPHYFQKREYRLHYFDLFHAISCQIAFRRTSIKDASVCFNPYMGAGSGNGAQEENKFLIDCYKKGLKIYYVPEVLGEIIEQESTWFTGYDVKFFYQRGGTTRKMLGLPLSVLYALYYVVRKRDMYSQEISPLKALIATLKGCFENPIGRQERTGNKN